MPTPPSPIVALTPVQTALWFGRQQVPGSGVYQCIERVDIRGDFDPNLFAGVLSRCLGEIPALNSRYFATPDGPRRSADRRVHEVRRVDVGGSTDAGAAERAAIDDVMSTGLAASAGDEIAGRLLSNQVILRIGPDHHVWIQRIDHLCVDGYSFATLLRWVAGSYSATVSGTPSPDYPFSDADTTSADGDPDEAAFWADYCDPGSIPASLIDRPPRAAEHGAHRVTRTLPARSQPSFGWAESVVACAATYISTLSGERDVVLGMPWANRKMGAAPTIEPAVNILPLRVSTSPTQTIDDLVSAVTGEIRAVRPHSGHPAHEIRRDLGVLDGDRALYGPVVNVKFFTPELQFGSATGLVGNIAMGPVDDVTFTASPQPDGGLRIEVEANPQRYSMTDTERHANRFAALLHELTSRPTGTLLGALVVADRTDVAEQIVEHNETSRALADETLRDLLVDAASEHSHRIAVSWKGGSLSYSELFAAATDLAARLTEYGAGPDHIVALTLPRSPEMVVAIVATTLAGAAYLPIDPELPQERIETILDDAVPVVLLAPAGESFSAPTTLAPEAWRWDELALELHPTRPTPDASTRAVPRPRDAAYVIYTSGSTGRPKGVIVEHRSIVNRLRWMDDTYRLTTSDRVLQKTSYAFDVSVWEFFWPLMTGAQLVLAAPGAERDSAQLARALAENGVTVCHFVPSALDAFLAEPVSGGLRSLRLVVCSGEALPVHTLERAMDVFGPDAVHNLYGPTEAAVDITSWHPEPDWDHTSVPIGLPVYNSAVYVLDAALRPLPAGSVGELYLAGRQLARGYLGRSGLTATRFVASPYAVGERMYATGDLARRHADGSVEYVGRRDDQVKVRGRRIELGEITAALQAVPGVSQAVTVVRGAGTSALLVGYVVPDPDVRLDTYEVRGHLTHRLPGYMLPDAMAVIDAIPTTSNGKLDRRNLPEPQLGTIEIDSPTEPLEMTLAAVFAEVVGRDQVSVTDSFFDLGGNSLLATRLAGRIAEVCNVDVQVSDVFAAPTVTALARRLSGDTSVDAFGRLLTLRDAGDAVPLFCIHPAGGLGWCYTGLLGDLDPEIGVYALQADGLRGGPLPTSLHAVARSYLREVERVAPQGPIRLLGWSVGGVIAHEMAVIAQARGRNVSRLCLLDAYPSELWQHQPAPTVDEIRRAFLIMAGVDDDTATRSDDDMVGALRRAHTAFGGLTGEQVQSISAVVAHFATLMRTHTTSEFDGDALLIRATEGAQDFLDPDAWTSHLTGKLTRIDVATTHPGLVRQPTMSMIARHLNEDVHESAATAAEELRAMVLGTAGPVLLEHTVERLESHGTPIVTDDPADPDRQRVLLAWTHPDGVAPTGVYTWVNRITDKRNVDAGVMQRNPVSGVWATEISVPRDTMATYRIYPFTATSPGISGGRVTYSRDVVNRAEPDPINSMARAGSPFGSVLRCADAPDLAAWDPTDADVGDLTESGQIVSDGMRFGYRRSIPRDTNDTDVDLIVVFDAEKWCGQYDLPAVLRHAHETGVLARRYAILGIDSPSGSSERLAFLGGNRPMLDTIAEVLIPAVAGQMSRRPNRVVVAGQSLGGLAALTLAIWHPGVVDEVLAYSPSVWWRPGLDHRPADVSDRESWIHNEIRRSHPASTPIRLAVGRFEEELAPTVVEVADTLRECGHPTELRVYSGGHDDPWWAALLLDDLSTPFPDSSRGE
ncbi:amino acid adenylation domain-containing protein [Gordonia sp. NPDC003424]